MKTPLHYLYEKSESKMRANPHLGSACSLTIPPPLSTPYLSGSAYNLTLPPSFDTTAHSHKKKIRSQSVLGCTLGIEKGSTLRKHPNRCSVTKITVKLNKKTSFGSQDLILLSLFNLKMTIR